MNNWLQSSHANIHEGGTRTDRSLYAINCTSGEWIKDVNVILKCAFEIIFFDTSSCMRDTPSTLLWQRILIENTVFFYYFLYRINAVFSDFLYHAPFQIQSVASRMPRTYVCILKHVTACCSTLKQLLIYIHLGKHCVYEIVQKRWCWRDCRTNWWTRRSHLVYRVPGERAIKVVMIFWLIYRAACLSAPAYGRL